MTSRLLIASSTLALLLVSFASSSVGQPAPPTADAWPAASSPTPVDSELEGRIAQLVAQMTLAQKIGQMTQPDVRHITPEEVSQYYIGSVLNGGGAWPNSQKDASIRVWADHAQRFHDAAMNTGMASPIPLIWGTDAVHGHNNVRGATLFPHNIGLGGANDPGLMHRIGRATARQVRATGIGWIFAPTLAVARDYRWGRTYESYSSDPALVARYASAMVQGLQGSLRGDGDVVATAKHFLGDGGTHLGVDQGDNRSPQAEMISVHAAGYYPALAAGVQTVMATYNSWNDVEAGHNYGKIHGSREVLTDVLKVRLGFDGFVVSDWNGIEQVEGCARDRCAQAINAGLDMIMVPEDWKAFIANTIEDVNLGNIPISRIDDAVTRILRVKMRAGLFERPISQGRFTGDVGAVEVDDLAREAVRKSVVLLKNNNSTLPLAPQARVLVVGASADSLSNQTGGWSLTWQGTENTNADFGGGDTLLAALRAALGDSNVSYSADASEVDLMQYDAVIAVLGETPYAEYTGDVRFPSPLQHSQRYPGDLEVLERVSGKGRPVITILYSGRPTYTNDLINMSDAFIAGFLPGTEGKGLSDLLIGGRYDFISRLSFAWPGSACSTGEHQGDTIQWPRGYGLSYSHASQIGQLPTPATPQTCPDR